MPTFAEKRDDNTLRVFTEDKSKDAVYVIGLQVIIEVPTDYSRTQFDTISQPAVFELKVVDPCKTTELDEFTIDDVTISVLGSLELRSLPTAVQDSSSREYGT